MSTDLNRERVEALAESAFHFTDEDIENAHEAMGEGEWQWFQWLMRQKAQALLDSPAMRDLLAEAWDEGHVAGRDYQGDGWNSDAHDPAEDNPYRQETA